MTTKACKTHPATLSSISPLSRTLLPPPPRPVSSHPRSLRSFLRSPNRTFRPPSSPPFTPPNSPRRRRRCLRRRKRRKILRRRRRRTILRKRRRRRTLRKRRKILRNEDSIPLFQPLFRAPHQPAEVLTWGPLKQCYNFFRYASSHEELLHFFYLNRTDFPIIRRSCKCAGIASAYALKNCGNLIVINL